MCIYSNNFKSWSLLMMATLFGSCLFSGAASAATTLTFTNNATPQNPFPATGAVGAFAFAMDKEFRVVSSSNTVSGGGEKSLTDVATGIVWQFSDDVNLSGVLNSQTTPGTDGADPGIPVSACAPAGATGLFLNAPFLGAPFGFVAPIVGSACATLYGNGTITVDPFGDSLQVVMPVAEAQWAQGPFPLGLYDDGVNGTRITFYGTMSNVQLNTPLAGQVTFDFVLIANHIIQPEEDSLGFASQTTQWELAGTGVAPFFVPNAPTASSGTLSPSLGGTLLNDGHISKSELVGIYGATNETGTIIAVDPNVTVTQVCLGLCFGYTVNTIGSPSVTVTLPLTTPIPQYAAYRQYISSAWKTFDESAGNTIESGPGTQGNCTGVVYTPGLTQDNYCVRLTIVDGGPNDADGTLNDAVVDLGGVVGLSGSIVPPTISGQSLDDAVGCSISNKAVSLTEKADWLVLLMFISALWMRKKLIK